MTADDAEHLRRYAANRDEAAFAELVRRYLNLVYFAALRQVGGDAHRAEDVTQAVFTLLARKATSLTRHQTLAGWLHTTTRFAASEALRAERRRLAREQEAHTMHELSTDPAAHAEWEQLRPVIDDALSGLSEQDREAVLLRFFANLPFAEVGAKLNLSENSARMRVDRALDKLHALLAKRGVTSTSSALAAVLANQAAANAPAGLAVSIAGSALSGAAVAGAGSLATLVYFMTAAKITVSLSVAGALAIGFAVYQSSQARTGATELARARGDRAELTARLAGLESSVTVAEKELAGREAALEQARLAKAAELAGSARRAAADEEKAKQEKALQQFLANDPELRKLRFERNRAVSMATNAMRRAKGLTPAQIEQATQNYAQKKEIQTIEKAAGIDSGIIKDADNRDATVVVRGLSDALFYADDPFTEQQANHLQAILTAAKTSNDAGMTFYARFDWDRVLVAAEPILSPKQMQGLRSLAAQGRNAVLLANVAKEAAASAKK